MKIKRYLEKDSRTALARVRAEMGADAVILSNKKVADGVELVAARDFDESAIESGLAEQQPENEPSSRTLLELQREMGKLRSLIEGELSQMSWKDAAARPSAKAPLNNQLLRLGLSRALAGSIADAVPANLRTPEQRWQKALELLTARITVLENRLRGEHNVIALVGSTGVGKTTTVAKLAGRFVLRHGARQVALITTDCYRIGGQEQLETFARYLDVPMVVATDGPQLKTALDRFASRKLVLIDTAGMSQRDIRLYEQFETLRSVGHNIDTHVVLSATAQTSSLNEVVKVFGSDALAGAIVTKLDESTSLGGVIDTVINHNLKPAFFSTGQKVPEDIIPARAEELTSRAVELVRRANRGGPGKYDNNHSSNSLAV